MPAPATSVLSEMLPAPAPDGLPARLLLYAIRRMGTHGLLDAHAANAMLGNFGMSYRRPLLLVRNLMLELSRTSRRKITITGCCNRRMTLDEAKLIEAVIIANARPAEAHLLLGAVLDTDHCLGALTTAQAIHAAFEDVGRPLG